MEGLFFFNKPTHSNKTDQERQGNSKYKKAALLKDMTKDNCPQRNLGNIGKTFLSDIEVPIFLEYYSGHTKSYELWPRRKLCSLWNIRNGILYAKAPKEVNWQ